MSDHRCGYGGCACSGKSQAEAVALIFGRIQNPDGLAFECRTDEILPFVDELFDWVPKHLASNETFTKDFAEGRRYMRMHISHDSYLDLYEIHVHWRLTGSQSPRDVLDVSNSDQVKKSLYENLLCDLKPDRATIIKNHLKQVLYVPEEQEQGQGGA